MAFYLLAVFDSFYPHIQDPLVKIHLRSLGIIFLVSKTLQFLP